MALIGFAPTKKPNAAPVAASDIIFDVTTANFEETVLKASMTTPLLIDFWAPWCGPCKQLTPTLEAEVKAAGGKVKLAKINIDENPDLAQAFRVQSVPTVIALFGGQPVTGFVGAQPASEIKKIITQLVKIGGAAAPDALDIPTLLAQADAAFAHNDFTTAQELYATVLAHDGTNANAYAGLIRTMMGTNDMTAAQELLAAADDAIKKSPAFMAAQTAYTLATTAPANTNTTALRDKITKNPDDHAARVALALALFASGDKTDAIDALINSIKRDRMWNDEAARKQLLQFFDAMGPMDPITKDGRRKLSSCLFS